MGRHGILFQQKLRLNLAKAMTMRWVSSLMCQEGFSLNEV